LRHSPSDVSIQQLIVEMKPLPQSVRQAIWDNLPDSLKRRIQKVTEMHGLRRSPPEATQALPASEPPVQLQITEHPMEE
jgi:hypothetical protein